MASTFHESKFWSPTPNCYSLSSLLNPSQMYRMRNIQCNIKQYGKESRLVTPSNRGNLSGPEKSADSEAYELGTRRLDEKFGDRRQRPRAERNRCCDSLLLRRKSEMLFAKSQIVADQDFNALDTPFIFAQRRHTKETRAQHRRLQLQLHQQRSKTARKGEIRTAKRPPMQHDISKQVDEGKDRKTQASRLSTQWRRMARARARCMAWYHIIMGIIIAVIADSLRSGLC